MSDADRRTQTRVPIEMWVEEKADDAVYFQRSANLSIGGLYLENAVPHAIGTRLHLQFTLPGESSAINTEAEIVKTDGGLGMHLKFAELSADATAQIERFIARTSGH